MAERAQEDNLHSAINLRTITDFDCYALTPCSCCVDVKLAAPPYSQDGELRAPIDLIAVIDRSGSMQGQKLNLVLQVLHFVLIHLQSRDRFAIVAYDECVEEVVPLSHVETANRLTSRAKIDQIQAGSSTNLSGGLIKGMNIMKERELRKADVASILLFTDGMANSGITDTGAIITAMENIYAGEKSFSVNTFGFGRDHKVHMLKEISRVGNGLYYFIQNTEQIPEILTNCLGGLLSTVGQNISIAIETSNGATVKEFISSKEKPQLSNGNTKGEVSMGDIQSEEERDVIIELSLPPSADSSPQPLSYGLVTLKYFNVIKKDNDQQQAQLILDRRSDLTGRVPSVEVDEQKNRIKTIASLAEAAAMAERGRLAEASRIISSQQAYISTSRSEMSPRVKSLTRDLNVARNSLKNESVYQNCGSSTLATLTDCHISQRSTGNKSYTTPSRASSYTAYVNTPQYSPDHYTFPRIPSPHIQPRGEIVQPDGLPNLPPKGAQQEESATPFPEPPRVPKRLSQRFSSSMTTTPTPLPDYEKGPPFISEI